MPLWAWQLNSFVTVMFRMAGICCFILNVGKGKVVPVLDRTMP
jgi:hypothetical protein